jgi:hypothetical protein
MMIKLLYSLLLLSFFLFFLNRIFNDLFYPIFQYFKRKNEHGYILISNWEFEHRVCVEKILKRKLGPHEEVHHINEKRWDNRRGNLSLMSKEKHREWHYQLATLLAQKKSPPTSLQRKILSDEFGAQLF